MTFEKATPYIRKICSKWADMYPHRFETDELFNEVWLGLDGDCSQFGDNYKLLGVAANRRIIEYIKRKDGRPGTVRFVGERCVERMLGAQKDVEGRFDGFAEVDSQDEWDYFMLRVRPSDQPILKMYYQDGLTLKEIADKLGRSLASVSSQQKRILSRLRRKVA